jgi:hypothetical protein
MIITAMTIRTVPVGPAYLPTASANSPFGNIYRYGKGSWRICQTTPQ